MSLRNFPSFTSLLILTTITISTSLAAPPKPPKPGFVGLKNDKEVDVLADKLRDLIVRNAPDPLFEKSYNWGHTERVPRGLEWHGKYLPLRPSVQYSDKEDGIWRRVKVIADNLDESLIFDIRNIRTKDDGRKLFDVYVSFNAKIFYDQQTWQNGHRLYAGSVRARVRPRATLRCELTTQMDFSKSFIPDVIFRLRVVKADLRYEDLVFEHWYGFGGEFAEKMGESVQKWIQDRHPELQEELLTKGGAAIVKAGDTKEIRLSLSNAFGNKSEKAEPVRNLIKKKK